jgi:hypothetical protein
MIPYIKQGLKGTTGANNLANHERVMAIEKKVL